MRSARQRHRILALSLIAIVAGVAFVASLATGPAGAQRKSTSYPRAQTLITSGTQWGNIQGFNPYSNAYAVGTVGLCNETLLRYDPLKNKYIDWLAKSAKFTSPKVFTVEVRPGIRWSNGEKLTGQDVAFNFKLGRFVTAYWNNLYMNLKSIKVKGLRLTFQFKGTPNYIQWQNLIWNLPMVYPEQYKTITTTTFTTFSPKSPIGTGPYQLASIDPTFDVVWEKKAVWWAAKQKLAPSPKPKYVEDLVLGNCNVNCFTCCPNLFDAGLDLYNGYLPGIQNLLAKGQFQTYYGTAPYDLAANTDWLELNTTHKPLNDAQFRRALAEAVNVYKIAGDGDYNGLATVANQTGLLKVWKKWIDQKEVSQYGFSRANVAAAKATLAAAGYKDFNSDGWVENKDGSTLNLKIEVPSGWSDWEAAESIIVRSAKAAGIHLTIIGNGGIGPEIGFINLGDFDLVIDNAYQLSDNPWTYFNGIFHQPITNWMTANLGRYKNDTAWADVKKLDQTPPTDVKGRKKLMSALEKIELTQVPIIPLWYNGVWSQTQSKYWKNWPSSTSKRNYMPTMWPGYMQMTGIDMIAHLKPA
jgi:peptide/nickel transport system substrate-binding protein